MGFPREFQSSTRRKDSASAEPIYHNQIPLEVLRAFTPAKMESRIFKSIALDLHPFSGAEGLHGQATNLLECKGLIFRTALPGYKLDWHCAPMRQYIIQLAGMTAIEVGDGSVAKMTPWDVLLAEDITGRGHCMSVVGTEQRFDAVFPIEEVSQWMHFERRSLQSIMHTFIVSRRHRKHGPSKIE